MLSVVLFASPFCLLPAKDSIEELVMGESRKKFSGKQNFICTLGIVIAAWGIAILVPTIGDAMTILGATTNSGIGFLLPIVFYLKIESENGGPWRKDKILSYVVFATICVCSVIELYTYANKKLD